VCQNNNGFYIYYEDNNITANYNNIMDNSGYGLRNDINYAIEAKYNYWGTTNETLIANMMDANVDYDPWLLTRPW